jgi:hypothetical protein
MFEVAAIDEPVEIGPRAGRRGEVSMPSNRPGIDVEISRGPSKDTHESPFLRLTDALVTKVSFAENEKVSRRVIVG